LWERIRLNLSWHVHDSAQVDRAREHILRQSTYLPVIASRGNYYLYYIVEEVQKRGMPVEIALLPVVESTLDPFAANPSGATGLWQIMPATGRHLGLERNAWYDGRKAVRDSTRVALNYLEMLYETFDEDWLLALAAYNSGEGRVSRARKANAVKDLGTDYWSLNLPRQTRNYVPKLIALAQIISNPEQFNVEIPRVNNAPAFEVANTNGLMEMSRAAELAGVDIATLRALNPGQLRGTLSPDRPPELLLPTGLRAHFESEVAKLPPQELVQWRYYQIKPGDTLSQIAEKFDTPVSMLRKMNGLRGNLIRAGDTLKIAGGGPEDSSELTATTQEGSARGYRVRAGDSLYRIANKFSVSIRDLIVWNALDPGVYLQPGQTLTLYN
tara:strand:+ start:14317 stop:15468 length:1152 start_codon:yes stop_codon:yes gene_type:complete